MKFDIFFSISQTPVDGIVPTEKEMFENFLFQVQAADELGFETAWVAESHFSSEVQKTHKNPVIPHWKGEVGLNTDIFQLAHKVFSLTKKIEVGSAVMNIVCNGGPIAAAEKLATFCTWHGLNTKEKRRIHVGFSAGRFEFMNRTSGIVPRNRTEELVWPALKGKIFWEASEIFLRLARGETISSRDIPPTIIYDHDFRSEEEWATIKKELAIQENYVQIANRWKFEKVKIIPQDWRRDLFVPIIGSHDPKLQEYVNQFLPVKVFNLSITKPEIIEDTHMRLKKSFHKDGGPWKREYMPRTVFVFINEEKNLSDKQKSEEAQKEATQALSAYWKALEGTLDPKKVEGASNNALVGNAKEVADQIVERFHPEDRLMLWFDFFNHDTNRIISNMKAFKEKVIPLVNKRITKKLEMEI